MDPKTLFETLASFEVEYVLIGGLAATAHGASLVTQDIDLCFRQTLDNCERLARALAVVQAEIVPRRPTSIPLTAELLHTHRVINLSCVAGRLDLVAMVPALGRYEEIVPGCDSLNWGGLRIQLLSLEQLVRSKSVLHSPKDREHLDQLQALKRLRQTPRT